VIRRRRLGDDPETRPIRVVYLPLGPQPGGAERQMLALAERLPRDRFQPELIVFPLTGPLVERATEAGIRVRSVGTMATPGISPVALLRRLANLFRLVRLIRSGRYDIVDAWLYPMDVLVALMRPLIHRPIILSGRRNVESRRRFGRLEPVARWIARRNIAIVVPNSLAAAETAISTHGIPPSHIRIIRNGVTIPEPVTGPARAAVRASLGIGDEDIVIGSVASYTPLKRLDLLVDSFGRLARSDPRLRLELIGEGRLRPALEAQIAASGIADRICLHGFEPAPERLYAAFDILAMSSDREGLPNALLEGSAAGCPIVTTAAGGAPEIVVDEETGLIVPVGDGEALSRALARLIDDADLRRRFGESARLRTTEYFGMTRYVEEFAALYEELGAARRAAKRSGPKRVTT
jgi:glycosyltransferase involved in cell wall biosynthesis